MSVDKVHKTIMQVQEDVLNASEPQKIPSLKNAIVMGVIIDASKPLKTKKDDFCQQIKIVDQSFNTTQYLHIFLFSSQIDDMLTIQNLGDIIYLKRFQYKIYNNQLQALKNRFQTSKILLISGQQGSDIWVKQIKPVKFNQSKISKDDEDRIHELMQWSMEYFSQLSIIKQSWKFQQEKDELYDLLLQVVSKERIEQSNAQKVILKDPKHCMYIMRVIEDEDSGCILKEKQIMKVRNTKCNEKKELLTKDSSIFFIPNYFYDSINFSTIDQQLVTHLNKIVDHTGFPHGFRCKVNAKIIDCQHHKLQEQLLYFCLRDESLEGSSKFLTVVLPLTNLKTIEQVLQIPQDSHDQIQNIITGVIEQSMDDLSYEMDLESFGGSNLLKIQQIKQIQ